MQLEKARFQADQKRPATTCAWLPHARQKQAGLWREKPSPPASEAWAGASMRHGSAVVRVRVRAALAHDRGWVVAHEKG
jgi:hypothetical protein